MHPSESEVWAQTSRSILATLLRPLEARKKKQSRGANMKDEGVDSGYLYITAVTVVCPPVSVIRPGDHFGPLSRRELLRSLRPFVWQL